MNSNVAKGIAKNTIVGLVIRSVRYCRARSLRLGLAVQACSCSRGHPPGDLRESCAAASRCTRGGEAFHGPRIVASFPSYGSYMARANVRTANQGSGHLILVRLSEAAISMPSANTLKPSPLSYLPPVRSHKIVRSLP